LIDLAAAAGEEVAGGGAADVAGGGAAVAGAAVVAGTGAAEVVAGLEAVGEGVLELAQPETRGTSIRTREIQTRQKTTRDPFLFI